MQSERDDAREIGARVRSLTHLCTFIAISIEIQDKSPSESGKRSDYSVERQFRCQMASLVVSHL